MAKYVAALGAVGAGWLFKEGYFEIEILVVIAITYLLIMKLWDHWINF